MIKNKCNVSEKSALKDFLTQATVWFYQSLNSESHKITFHDTSIGIIGSTTQSTHKRDR